MTSEYLIPLGDAIEKLIDYRGKTPKKTSSGIPLVTAKIVKNGKINTPQEFIDKDDYEAWMVRGFPKKGDVVLTTEAPLGEVATIDDENIALAQRIVVLRGKEGLLNNTYLKYHLMSHDIQHQLQSRASGTTVLGIKQSELRKIVLKIPPIKVQQKIADNLDLLYQLSKQNETIVSNLNSIISALFRSWFIDFDPVKAKAEGRLSFDLNEETAALFPDSFKDSQIGPIPSGWRVGTLGDIATKTIGGVWGEEQSHDNLKPVRCLRGVDIGDLRNRKAAFPPTRWVSDGQIQSRRLFDTDVLIAGSGAGPLGKTIHCHTYLQNLYSEIVVYSNFVSRLKCSSISEAFFVEQTLHSMWQSKEIWSYATGSAIPNLDLDGLLKKKIVLPSNELMVFFFNSVENLIDIMNHIVIESNALNLVKDALLQRLMSGELEVPVET